MRHEYELHSDVLETIVASSPITKGHAALLSTFASRTEFRGARHVLTRNTFGERPARILDVTGEEIAADYHEWVERQLGAYGGSARTVWAAYKQTGYQLTQYNPVLHYFVQDRGDDPDNFVQIEVWEEREFVERELFSREHWGAPETVDDLFRASSSGYEDKVERRDLGGPLYRLETAIDMKQFSAIAEKAFSARRRRDGDRQLIETDASTGESRVVSVRELCPDYDRQQWSGRRLFDDWAESSAGRSGARICAHWTFRTSDHTDAAGVRHVDFIPQWAHKRTIGELKNTHRLDAYGLYSKLRHIDDRVGADFAFYFYGLHGNIVKSGHLERILEAAEQGLIVLPEHDYRVLKRWHGNPYGF